METATDATHGRRHRHLRWVGLYLLLLVCLGTTVRAFRIAHGQENGQAADAAAAPDGDGQAGNSAEVSESAAAADTRQLEPESFLTWMIRANGWFFGPLLLALSFCMVALIVMNILEARRENFIPTTLVDQFDKHLKKRRYQEAYDTARNDSSFLGRVLAAGLGKLPGGYPQAVEAMQEEGEKENMALDHKLSYLAMIGTVAPMIGLMGTVYGMIESFRVIADSDVSPKPSQLAGGISTALFTTLEGLIIAVPAIAAYGILRNRVARLVLEVGIVSESLMGRFSNVGRRSGGASGPAGATPQADGGAAAG